jgi:hypothetical protein
LPITCSTSIEADAADAAAVAVEVGLGDLRGIASHIELDPYDVAAQRVVVFVRVRRVRAMSAMERVLVMIEDVFLIEFVFVLAIKRHSGAASCGKWRVLSARAEALSRITILGGARQSDNRPMGDMLPPFHGNPALTAEQLRRDEPA